MIDLMVRALDLGLKWCEERPLNRQNEWVNRYNEWIDEQKVGQRDIQGS